MSVSAEEKAAVTGIGDINSKELGSGARYNAGKPPLELIPAKIMSQFAVRFPDQPLSRPEYTMVLKQIGRFQMREAVDDALLRAIYFLGAPWAECAHVFKYGLSKYAPWNWAKGMPWSVPIGCIQRHIIFGTLAGETHDAESGRHHDGHIMCNLVMLYHYVDFYPEGDDRPVLPTRNKS